LTDYAFHINGARFPSPLRKPSALKDTLAMEVFELIEEWQISDRFKLTTSGSTGAPKPIYHSKKAIIQSARGTADFFSLKEGTKALCCLPLKKIAGRMMLYRSLVNHWELTVQHPEGNPLKTAKPYDFVALTPFQAHQVIKENPAALNQVKTVILGGAKVDSVLIEALQSFNCAVWETYGMTETLTHIAAKQISPYTQEAFHCLPSIEVRVNKEDQLCISSPYFSEIITNDVVQLIDKHTFQLLGRKDFVINSGGLKLFPEQIESKLMGVIEDRFYITKSPHETLGEQVTIVIESSPYQQHQLEKFKSAITRLLSKFEVPKKYVFLPHFEETTTGKIIRKAL
jgi:O-succinylbenzoic acid--CoA ligase